jgi:hypothetical protein
MIKLRQSARSLFRRLWFPPADFTIVLVLSVVLGVWPVLDPAWTFRGAYYAVVGGLMLTACFFSARARRTLEDRYLLQHRAQIARLRARTFQIAKVLSEIVKRRRAEAGAKALVAGPSIADEFATEAVNVLGILLELAEYDVMATRQLQVAIDDGVKTLDELRLVAASLVRMGNELGSLNTRAS